MRLVWSELLEANIVQMFFDEKCIPTFFLIVSSLADLEGTRSGFEYSRWGFPVSFMLVLVPLILHQNFHFSSNCSSTLFMDG